MNVFFPFFLLSIHKRNSALEVSRVFFFKRKKKTGKKVLDDFYMRLKCALVYIHTQHWQQTKTECLTCKFTTDWGIDALCRFIGSNRERGLEVFPPIETYKRSCFLPLYYHEGSGSRQCRHGILFLLFIYVTQKQAAISPLWLGLMWLQTHGDFPFVEVGISPPPPDKEAFCKLKIEYLLNCSRASWCTEITGAPLQKGRDTRTHKKGRN